MYAIGLRWAAALLVAAVLLVAAAPAVAGPPERPAGEPGFGRPLFIAFTAWLAGLRPDSLSGPAPALAALGSGGEPEGGPGSADGGPTADPQLGSGLDPNG